METMLLLVLGSLGIGILLGAIGFAICIPEKKRINHLAFYSMGAMWLVLGIPINALSFMLLGLFFMIMAMMYKHKWSHPAKWEELKPKEKAQSILLFLFVLFVIISVVLGYFQFGISSSLF